jgi:tRNA 2-thiouridine synthesizing protein A
MEDPSDEALQETTPARLVDARGHRCPVPTLRLRRNLEGLVAGQRVLLIADDPMARIDVPYFVSERAHLLVKTSQKGDDLYFLIEKR